MLQSPTAIITSSGGVIFCVSFFHDHHHNFSYYYYQFILSHLRRSYWSYCQWPTPIITSSSGGIFCVSLYFTIIIIIFVFIIVSLLLSHLRRLIMLPIADDHNYIFRWWYILRGSFFYDECTKHTIGSLSTHMGMIPISSFICRLKIERSK